MGDERRVPTRGGRSAQPASALTRFVRREILREAAFLWTMPFCAARASLGSAALNASVAAFGSLEAIASSTLRTYVRISVRRDLFTAVRAAGGGWGPRPCGGARAGLWSSGLARAAAACGSGGAAAVGAARPYVR